MIDEHVSISNGSEALALFGSQDRVLKRMRETFNVSLVHRDGDLRIRGEAAQVQKCAALVRELLARIRAGGEVTEEDVDGLAAPAQEQGKDDDFTVKALRFAVKPRTEGQQAYADAIRTHDIVFVTGPAGTGKTYLAVAAAIQAMRNGDVKKMILARPAVEAGEKLGFLPGDFQAKVNPYLKPLYDALEDFLEPAQIKRFIEREVFEVVPLAFMRGRTLNNAFIILDEAQNTTTKQMMMFLTRMGNRSKAIITGDVTQVDLPKSKKSGLVHAKEVLAGVEGIAFVELNSSDIMRHKLVRDIVHAWRGTEEEGLETGAGESEDVDEETSAK